MTILLLLGPASLAEPSAPPLPAPLSWRFRAGDDPAWAEIAIDDADWAPLTPPATWPTEAGSGGYAWLRTVAEVPAGTPLAVALGPVRDVYEVYADGALVGVHGRLPPDPEVPIPQPASHALPVEATRDGEVVVAVRMWRDPRAAAAFPAQPTLGPGPWMIAPVSLAADAVELAVYRERSAGLPRFVLFVLYAAVGLYHLMLFARIPKYREYFWFGVTALGLAGNVLVVSGWTAEITTSLDTTVRLLTVAFHVQIAAFALFLWNLIGRPMSAPTRALVGVHLALAAAMVWLGGYPDGLITAFARGLLLVPLAIAALWVTSQAAWRGHTDARLLFLGGLPLFLAVVHDRVVGVDSLVGGYVAYGFGAFVLSIAGMLASRFARLYAELDQRNLVLSRINSATSRFVPFPFLDMLGRASVVEVELGDQVQRDMTILFTDIRSFTTLSEGMTAAQTFAFINAYLSRMEPVVGQHGGFIDKYIGDSIMALFPRSADDAVAAAAAMVRSLEEFNEVRARAKEPPIAIGIGINTGPLMLGTVGGHNRMDTTVISDAVNLASRTEGATKRYGATVLLTQASVAALARPDDVTLRRVDRIAVKGKTQPVTVYELLDVLPPAVRDARVSTRDALAAALDALASRDLDTARQTFAALAAAHPDDPVPRVHLARVDEVLASGRAAQWDGVTQLSEK